MDIEWYFRWRTFDIVIFCFASQASLSIVFRQTKTYRGRKKVKEFKEKDGIYTYDFYGNELDNSFKKITMTGKSGELVLTGFDHDEDGTIIEFTAEYCFWPEPEFLIDDTETFEEYFKEGEKNQNV